jgi:hypothetical protein
MRWEGDGAKGRKANKGKMRGDEETERRWEEQDEEGKRHGSQQPDAAEAGGYRDKG